MLDKDIFPNIIFKFKSEGHFLIKRIDSFAFWQLKDPIIENMCAFPDIFLLLNLIAQIADVISSVLLEIDHMILMSSVLWCEF